MKQNNFNLWKLFSFLIVIIFIFASSIFSNEQKDNNIPIFTNEDLNRYREQNVPMTKSQSDIIETRKNNKEYWCKQGDRLNKDIEKLKTEIAEIKQKIASLEKTNNKMAKRDLIKFNSALKRKEKHLAEKNQIISSLEDEAHQKNIPPGWLKCNFSY